MKNKLYLLLAGVLVLVPMLFAKPVAAEETVKTQQGWSLTKTLIEKATGAVGENVEQLGAKMIYGIGDFTLTTICPQCVENRDAIAQSDLPDSMKYGLVGMVDNGVMAMFNNAPNVDVVASLAKDWVPGYDASQSVYADGYSDLKSTGIDSFWSQIRNIAYLGYVVIMIIIGFMIMFRNKIGGQVLVTLGNSIPKVIISLILVTFSFAIAGLIIDIGGVLLRLISTILYGGVGEGIPIHDIFAVFGGILGIGGGVAAGAPATLGIAGLALGATGFLSGLAIIGIIITLVVLGFVIVGAVKLWFVLIKSYIGILVDVVTGPIQIMMGAMPGNDTAIGNWIKSILRNVLVFPVAYAIVNLPFSMFGDALSVNWTGFPEGLVIGGSNGDLNLTGLIIIVFKIMVIYLAAETPTILKAVIPATASKSGADVGAAIKESFSKAPLIGGLFGGK